MTARARNLVTDHYDKLINKINELAMFILIKVNHIL
jgi:hypothetical protein